MQQVLMVTPAARETPKPSSRNASHHRAADPIDGLHEAEAGDVSAVVIDVASLGPDGLTMLARLRDLGLRAHLLAVVAARDDNALIRSIELGADGVADDECSPRALAMRLRALTRRGRPVDEPIGDIQIGALHLNVDARALWRGDRRIDLTPREFDVLLALVRQRGCVVNPARLLADRCGGPPPEAPAAMWNLVRAYVHGLRRKLGGAGAPACIVTIRGAGYMIPRT
jgi:DNA-binding response OmpR family regulator